MSFPQIRCHAVVFDLEFTAWEGSLANRWLRPGEYTEVVQIGAARLDANSLDIIETFSALVRPRINREISPYFQKLTGISNERLALEGVDFVEAYARFLKFADGAPLIAFGRDDLIIESNLRLYGLQDVPSLPSYTNLIPWLVEQGIDPRGMHACDVGPYAGIAFEGQKHNALDDARSVARGIAALVKKGARNPFLESA